MMNGLRLQERWKRAPLGLLGTLLLVGLISTGRSRNGGRFTPACAWSRTFQGAGNRRPHVGGPGASAPTVKVNSVVEEGRPVSRPAGVEDRHAVVCGLGSESLLGEVSSVSLTVALCLLGRRERR